MTRRSNGSPVRPSKSWTCPDEVQPAPPRSRGAPLLLAWSDRDWIAYRSYAPEDLGSLRVKRRHLVSGLEQSLFVPLRSAAIFPGSPSGYVVRTSRLDSGHHDLSVYDVTNGKLVFRVRTTKPAQRAIFLPRR